MDVHKLVEAIGKIEAILRSKPNQTAELILSYLKSSDFELASSEWKIDGDKLRFHPAKDVIADILGCRLHSEVGCMSPFCGDNYGHA